MEQMPVYVRIKDPKQIQDIIGFLHVKIAEARSTLQKIKELSGMESHHAAEWKANFDEINRKLNEASASLLEPERV